MRICSPSKPWKSDTKMIWGGPIFSVSWWRCDDVDGDGGEDNYRVAANSPAQTPLPMQRLLNPVGYSEHHDLAHVAVDHERYSCNSLIPDGTTNHTQLIVGKSGSQVISEVL